MLIEYKLPMGTGDRIRRKLLSGWNSHRVSRERGLDQQAAMSRKKHPGGKTVATKRETVFWPERSRGTVLSRKFYAADQKLKPRDSCTRSGDAAGRGLLDEAYRQ
jgi:hypothetical protein